MKRLLMTTALIAASATGVYAQTNTEAAAESDAAAPMHNGSDSMFRSEPGPMEIHASNFIGMRVYTSENEVDQEGYEGLQDNWEDIGEINDVVLSRDGSVDAVLVDIGGFLGIGERQISVDMNAIKFVSDDATAEDEGDFFLVMNASRASLEEAPEYSWDRAENDAEMAMNDAENAAENTADDVAVAADNAGDKMENAAEETGDAIEDTAENAAEETDEAIDNAQGELQPMTDDVASDEAADPAATGAATGMAANETMNSDSEMANNDAATNEMVADEGYTMVRADELTAEDLTGARVYDSTDQWIGEVSELLLDGSSKIDRAVVDVGGFLGIGEKPVALASDELNIQRENDGDDIRVRVNMTKEQLESLPEYED
ncbi:MAG: PRC-barrel domain-containing protein [Heliomarina sp.]|uniref:PRC-barrel domain-containing protein n=1 Tax=Heliomarina sp. TaxID=2917556 RepID=UPI004058C180